MIWRVWPIHHPDLVDEEEPVKGFTIDGPRAAVEIACDGDLDFCGVSGLQRCPWSRSSSKAPMASGGRARLG